MPKVTIDGQEIEVPAGTRVIEAAKQLGIEIPHYCYHPGLSIAGSCRLCLVEIEKIPKLQIACHTVVTDGMVVLTRSDWAVRARAAEGNSLLWTLESYWFVWYAHRERVEASLAD